MVPFIIGPQEHHRVSSPDRYLQEHRRFVERQRRHGARYQVHDSDQVLDAWIGEGQWLVQCECGAGNSTAPRWALACCYACGAIHRQIVFPGDWRAIEASLLLRHRPADRHWVPGASLDDLIAENSAVGIA